MSKKIISVLGDSNVDMSLLLSDVNKMRNIIDKNGNIIDNQQVKFRHYD